MYRGVRGIRPSICDDSFPSVSSCIIWGEFLFAVFFPSSMTRGLVLKIDSDDDDHEEKKGRIEWRGYV